MTRPQLVHCHSMLDNPASGHISILTHIKGDYCPKDAQSKVPMRLVWLWYTEAAVDGANGVDGVNRPTQITGGVQAI